MDIDYPDDGEDDTTKAYASIAAQLEQFTSPHLAAPQDTSYQMDAMDWLKQELKEEAPTAPVEADLKTPVKKKRTSLLERADTPVMSNSSLDRPLSGRLFEVQITADPGANYSRSSCKLQQILVNLGAV